MAASSWGRLLGVFGDPEKGLTADLSRQVVDLAWSVPVGDGETSIVVGPMDLGTSDGVADPFLKVLEEPPPYAPRVYMWAWDVGEVRPTIRSRALEEWCPGRVRLPPDTVTTARSVVSGVRAGDVAAVVGSMLDFKEGWASSGGLFLRAVAAEVAPGLAEADEAGRRPLLRLWARIRPLAGLRHVSWNEALAAVLP
jgi:hypothetical protein